MRRRRRSPRPLVASIVIAVALLGATVALPTTTAAFSASTSTTSSFATSAATCPGQTFVMVAEADATVRLLEPLANFGTTPLLRVVSAPAATQRSLLRFPLPTIPPGCTMLAATLNLNSVAHAPRTLVVEEAATAWSEVWVTWLTQPVSAGTSVTGASATPVTSIDVLPIVVQQFVGSNHGIIVRDAAELELGTHSNSFASSEQPGLEPAITITVG